MAPPVDVGRFIPIADSKGAAPLIVFKSPLMNLSASRIIQLNASMNMFAKFDSPFAALLISPFIPLIIPFMADIIALTILAHIFHSIAFIQSKAPTTTPVTVAVFVIDLIRYIIPTTRPITTAMTATIAATIHVPGFSPYCAFVAIKLAPAIAISAAALNPAAVL